MLALLSRTSRSASFARAFSTSRASPYDLAKLTLVGRLAKEVEFKETKNGREYAAYVVATTNYPPPPMGEGNVRAESSTSWHRIMSFVPSSMNYLRSLETGTLVYVEANYEVREPVRDAEPGTPQAQRHIYLRQESIRTIKKPAPPSESS